jgi:hypothetical protein
VLGIRTFQALEKTVLAKIAFPARVLVVSSVELLFEGVDATEVVGFSGAWELT